MRSNAAVPRGFPGRRAQAGYRRVVGLALLAAAAMLLAVASLALGSRTVAPGAVLTHLLGGDAGYAGLVVDARIPRTLVGLMVGASLGVAGAVLQGITRNPLGDPGVFGINAGAAATVVTAGLVPGLAELSAFWSALPGALLAGGLVGGMGLASREEGPARLVLAGAALSACLFAYVQAVTLLDQGAFETYRHWVLGSLNGVDLNVAATAAPYLLAGLLLLFAQGRSLNATTFDEDTAVALGASLTRTRLSGLLGAGVLAAAATAMAGPIAFVGLATAHLARHYTGNDFRWLLPYSLFGGAVLLLAADIIGRLVLAPAELMAGVVTAFLGGPFLYLVARRQHRGRV